MNPAKKFLLQINVGLFFFFGSCATFSDSSSQELVASDVDYAIFILPASNWKKLLPEWFSNQENRFSTKKIPFSALCQQTTFRFGILHTKEYDLFLNSKTCQAIEQSLHKLQNSITDSGFLILMKEEDPLSPYTKILRNCILIVPGEKETFHFVFLELRNNVNFLTQYTFEDWAFVKPQRMLPSSKDELRLRKGELVFTIVSIATESKIIYYGRWISQGSLENLTKPILSRVPDEEELPIPKPKTNEERLEEIDSLRKKGLISEEEWKLKKKEILNSI